MKRSILPNLTWVPLGTMLLISCCILSERMIFAEETEVAESTESVESTKDGESLFIRVRKNDAGERQAVETSLITYASEDGARKVTLIGAVHVGEKSYYDSLNEKFKNYDVVLYEVVAEEGTRPQSSSESSSVIGMIQRTFGNSLGLSFQIGSIDYNAENMVHADMTPDEFAVAMKGRNESFWTWYFRSAGYEVARTPVKTNSSEDVNMLRLLVMPNKKRELKRIFSKQMEDLQSSIVPIEGKEGSSILTDRNKKVIRILKEHLDAGQTNIAIFYGAAHLPQMAQILEDSFQMKRESVEWLTAWDLTK